MTTPRVHLGYLDGMRGWAAIWVTLHHVWQFVVQRSDIDQLPAWFTVFTVFKPGGYAVTIFIALSGYCLALPAARAAVPGLTGGVQGFILRRARRILPPYYAAVALSLFLVLLVPKLQSPTDTQWDFALPATTITGTALHALLIHNWFEDWQWTLNPPLWSVALEWQIYFVFALLLLPLWRRGGVLVALLAALVLGILPLAFGGAFAHPWYLGSFGIGMAAAAVGFAPAFRSNALVARIPWRAVALAFAVLPVADVGLARYLPVPQVIVELSLSVTVGALMVHLTIQAGSKRPSMLLSLLEHGWSVRLGGFSYSLYLIHYPILALMALPLRSVGPLLEFALLMVIGLPLMLLASYAFHLVFERPFMSTSSRPARPAVLERADRQYKE
jgi:peptidoglycan/LPS O-acetylase OafA/YrhL